MPEGVIRDHVGEAERQKDAFGSLGIAMMIWLFAGVPDYGGLV